MTTATKTKILTCQYKPGTPCPHDGRCRLCDLYLRLYGHKCGLTPHETIVEILEEYACNPQDYDTAKVAEEITWIAVTDYKREVNKSVVAGEENRC